MNAPDATQRTVLLILLDDAGSASSSAFGGAPLARTLKLNRYATALFGTCHELPVWETSPMGRFDAWPTDDPVSPDHLVSKQEPMRIAMARQ